MREVCHSKPILPADEKPLKFYHPYHENNRTGACVDKIPVLITFRCPNNYNEFILLIPIADFILLKERNIKHLRPNTNFIFHISGYNKSIISVSCINGQCDLD